MIGQFVIDGKAVRVDFSNGTCIAIPLDFSGRQPNHFGAQPARAEPMKAGRFVGDTKQGGSCNVPCLSINPHCNGTHTETVSHIVNEPVSVHATAPAGLVPTTLITVKPIDAICSRESYRPGFEQADRIIAATALATVLDDIEDSWLNALLIRTSPNSLDKLRYQYGTEVVPPFFSIEATDYLVARGVKHLLVDMPSVDRMYDEGLLTVHHRFWRIPDGTHELIPSASREKTITEMIYVPDAVPDGHYLLDLQIPAFSTDVAPSRPWLYPVEFI